MTPADGGGLRKRRTGFFVQVPRETIRDSALSWKARGLLTYLLDMPDGWDVRSEFLANEGPDGKDAVQTGLKELRTHGYYRLERRRLRDGTLLMGTAISEVAVPEWVAENTEFEGKAVPVHEQVDGSFKIRHKDGSLTSDGFDEAASEHGMATGAGFSGSGKSDAGSADSGSSDAGEPRPLEEKEKGDLEGETERGENNAPAAADAGAALPGLPTDVPSITNRAIAEAITKAWHAKYTAENGPVVNGQRAHFALRGIVEQAIEAGYTENEIKHALLGLASASPAVGAFQNAIGAVRAGRPVTRGGKTEPGNVHHASDNERKRSW